VVIGQQLKFRNGLGFDGLWLQLGPGDFRALKYFGQMMVNGDNLGSVTRIILRLALLRPAVVIAWMEAMSSYCYSEDIIQEKFLADSVAARREYRRVKVGA
jgi:hypothetical protein